jgi:hypothetical protein
MARISTTPFAPSHVPCSTRTLCSADCIMGPIPMEPLTGGATDTINFVLPFCSRFAKIHGVQLRACASSAGLIDHTLQELRTSHCSLSLRLGGIWTALCDSFAAWDVFTEGGKPLTVMDDALDLTPLLCGSGLCCPCAKRSADPLVLVALSGEAVAHAIAAGVQFALVPSAVTWTTYPCACSPSRGLQFESSPIAQVTWDTDAPVPVVAGHQHTTVFVSNASCFGAYWFAMQAGDRLPTRVVVHLNEAVVVAEGHAIVPVPSGGFMVNFASVVAEGSSMDGTCVLNVVGVDAGSRQRALFMDRVEVAGCRVAALRVCLTFTDTDAAASPLPVAPFPVFSLEHNILRNDHCRQGFAYSL